MSSVLDSVIGFIVVPESDLEIVKSELPNHIRLTREESGCISFRVTQSKSDPTRFNVAEEFKSRYAFEQHQLRVKSSIRILLKQLHNNNQFRDWIYCIAIEYRRYSQV
ncbi:MAG: antibiotic biosynthesis monooxygenase [Cyanothece sp. SIO1E1]|nr:antibiotic biosynthesis monooxygenase [Cyanothece sp. SIO1E1]